MAKSFLNKTGYPVGLRNNNPGNLVKTSIDWEGKIPHSQNTTGRFEQFIELRYGIRAKMRDLVNDIKKGTNTITKLINEFAPPHENNTLAYINSVANTLGINPNMVIEPTEDTIVALCKIIAMVENGNDSTGKPWSRLITDQDYQDALDILGMDLKKKQSPEPTVTD